jgi:hypothetical protein
LGWALNTVKQGCQSCADGVATTKQRLCTHGATRDPVQQVAAEQNLKCS